MTYTRAEQGKTTKMLIIFFLITSLFFTESSILQGFRSLLLLFLVLPLWLSYKLTIEEGRIRYGIYFFRFRLYEKIVKSESIKSIIFKRTGWSTKKAVINRRGHNIWVIYYEPAEIYEELESFAAENGIAVKKTRDYKLLEKYY
ncbi:hypothetical protein FZC79_16215 [Rossellomorea vietnamensis]|uniref:DUF5673 domain-containing protein n=1 Tax=Rossellomorea vietnamensis TaxID=218284 RepID=A0A5D4KAR2_9BACI|nr:hypothetical protein [Rossellomorea vietnamensis]TYR73999.1 hypothetical protein FZC79_16215 [Rossellomorea vietnamensis]